MIFGFFLIILIVIVCAYSSLCIRKELYGAKNKLYAKKIGLNLLAALFSMTCLLCKDFSYYIEGMGPYEEIKLKSKKKFPKDDITYVSLLGNDTRLDNHINAFSRSFNSKKEAEAFLKLLSEHKKIY